MLYFFVAEAEQIFKAFYVAPVVAYLCHDSCTDTGGVYEVEYVILYDHLCYPCRLLEGGHLKVHECIQLTLAHVRAVLLFVLKVIRLQIFPLLLINCCLINMLIIFNGAKFWLMMLQ